jgi:hypothetical protein
MEALKKSDVKIVHAKGPLLDEARKLSAPVVDDWIKKASAKGVDAKGALSEFRAELKKLQK